MIQVFPEKRATTLSCFHLSVSHHLQLDHVNDFDHFLGWQLRKWGWMHHLARHSVACFLTRGDLVRMIYTVAWFMLFVCNFGSKLARQVSLLNNSHQNSEGDFSTLIYS
jgi:hypothetical protein